MFFLATRGPQVAGALKWVNRKKADFD